MGSNVMGHSSVIVAHQERPSLPLSNVGVDRFDAILVIVHKMPLFGREGVLGPVLGASFVLVLIRQARVKSRDSGKETRICKWCQERPASPFFHTF